MAAKYSIEAVPSTSGPTDTDDQLEDLSLTSNDFVIPASYISGQVPELRPDPISRQLSELEHPLRVPPRCERCKCEPIVWCKKCSQLLCADCITQHKGHGLKSTLEYAKMCRANPSLDQAGHTMLTGERHEPKEGDTQYLTGYVNQVDQEVDHFVSEVTSEIKKCETRCEKQFKEGLSAHTKVMCNQATERGRFAKLQNRRSLQEYFKNTDTSKCQPLLSLTVELRSKLPLLKFAPMPALFLPEFFSNTMGFLTKRPVKVIPLQLINGKCPTGETIVLTPNCFLESLGNQLYCKSVIDRVWVQTQLEKLDDSMRGMCVLNDDKETRVYCTTFTSNGRAKESGRANSLIIFRLVEAPDIQLEEEKKVVLPVKGIVSGVSILSMQTIRLVAIATVYRGVAHISVHDTDGNRLEWDSSQEKWTRPEEKEVADEKTENQPTGDGRRKKQRRRTNSHNLCDSDDRKSTCDLEWISHSMDIIVLLKVVKQSDENNKSQQMESSVYRINYHQPDQPLWKRSLPPSDSIYYFDGLVYVVSHSENSMYVLSPFDGMDMGESLRIGGQPRGMTLTNHGEVAIIAYGR